MTANDSLNLEVELKNGLKSQKLDLIANFMDTILNNMKSHVLNVHENKNNDSSITKSDSQNFLNADQKEIPDTQTPHQFEIQNQTKKQPVSSKSSKGTESNKQIKKKSLNKKRMNSAKCYAPSSVRNTQRKGMLNVTQPNINRNVKKPIMKLNSSFGTNSNYKSAQQNASPRKMLVVYKENDKFVSRSLTTMLKQTYKPQISTWQPYPNTSKVPTTNVNRKNNDSRSRSQSITPLANKTNFKLSNARSRSSNSKPANTIVHPLQQTTAANNHIRSKSITSNSSKNTGSIVKQDSVKSSVKSGTINKKPSLYVSRKELMEKNINRNNQMLRPMSMNSELFTSGNNNSNNNTRTISLNSNPVKQKQPRINSPGMSKRFSPNENKRPSQQNKANNEVGKAQNAKQIEIINRIQFQNVIKTKKFIKQNQKQVSSEPSKSVSNSKLAVPIQISQNAISKTVTPIKFMKNNENTKLQQINTNDTPEKSDTDNINENTENETENLSQGESSTNINEMGDSSVTVINEKIQQIIDTITEETELNDPKINAEETTCLNEKEKIENVTSNSNIKPETSVQLAVAKTIVETQVTICKQPISQKSNKINFIVNNNRIYLNKGQQSKQNINNQPNKPSSIILKPPIIKRVTANSTSVIPRNPNIICIPNRKLSVLTPMEIVQDFVNLVNRAKRDRKTFTVCGNYYSIRRAFAERGWVEKLRINLVDDKESWRRLENLSNYELVEGMKDKESGDKYRRIFISKLLAGHQVDFYWDYMTNPFVVNNDKIKRTLINRFPFGASRSYTSKAGLCESLKESYWYYIEGYSNILFPRTYNMVYDEEVSSFVEDFRRTAVMSLLQWVVKNIEKPSSIISPTGQIPTSVFNFATLQCYNLIKNKEHKDIDEIIPVAKEYEWDIFLEKYYKIVHQGNHFKETQNITAPLLIDQSRYILNKLRKYYPQIDYDGNMNLWLLKPNNGSRGCGIHVCRTLRYTLDTVNSRKDTKYVIQKYLERPLLIHNTKFDIRQWFLITCIPNLHVWLYKDCYLRFSSQMYDLSKLHESIHLTNNSIQCRYKNNSNRNNDLPDQNMWHSDTFRKYLSDIGQPYAWRNIIYKGIKECFVGLFMLCQDKILTRVNSFELCGADFMLTEDYRPYLIEINSRPALYPSTKITAKMCPKVLEDVVKVTIDYARNPRASTGNFELIYKDTFNYMPPKNLNTVFIEGINYKKFAEDKIKKPVPFINTEKFAIKEIDYNSGTIEKILKIDPNKVRKDVKNTLEKILAIIHSEQHKDVGSKSDDKSKQFRMMLSEFVDIISCVKNKTDKNK